MFAHVQQDWEAFKASRPGHRFQDVHKRRKEEGGHSSSLRKVLMIGAGLLLIAAGIFFLVMPGPGTVVMFVGVALIARESLSVARLLDRVEVLLRPSVLWILGWWRSLSATQRVVLSALAVVLGGMVCLVLYFYVIR